MRKKLLFISFITLLLSSCNYEVYDQSDQLELKREIKILKSRDKNYPLILSNKKLFKKEIPNDPIEIQYYLGRSFKDNSAPISSPENISFPILDIEKLYNDYPNYIYTKQLNISEGKAFSFSDFSNYETKSSFTKKVNGGLSLNLGLFKIGAKKSFEEVFSSNKINENKRIFGELNIIMKGNSYSLQSSSNINQKYYAYFTKEFLQELYNTHTSELIRTYGRYILTDFVSGGRASAFYTGVVNKTASKEENEKKMDTSISASYGFKPKSDNGGNVSAELGFGKINGSGISTSTDISNIEVSVKTIGGNNGLSGFTSPKDINDVNINLSSWVSSLNDKTTWNIIDINDNGLLPISNFILEENFKKRISKIYDNTNILSLSEPYMEIQILNNYEVKRITLNLITRQGDRITLKDSGLFPAQVPDEYFTENYINTANSFSGMKLISSQVTGVNFGEQYNTDVDFMGIDMNNMFKYKNPKNGITYLMYNNLNDKKYAFSIYDNFIYNTYAFGNWSNNLPIKIIDENDFLSYKIVGL